PSRRMAPQHWQDALGPKSGGPAAQPVIAHTLALDARAGPAVVRPGLSDVFPVWRMARPWMFVRRWWSPWSDECFPCMSDRLPPLAWWTARSPGRADARCGSGSCSPRPCRMALLRACDRRLWFSGWTSPLVGDARPAAPGCRPPGLGDARPRGADHSPTGMGGDTVGTKPCDAFAHCGGAVRLRRPDRAARNRQHWARLICSSWNDLGLRLHGTLSFKTPGAALARLRLA